MEKIITDGKSIEIRYSDEKPKNNIKFDDICSRVITNNSKVEMQNGTYLSLELSKHTGPRILYGKIGIIFEKSISNKIKIKLPYSYENSEHYENSILYNKEYCYKGIPKEYVEDIVDGIENYISKVGDFPKCDITIVDGANCEIGSSSACFRIIISVLLDLFVSRKYIDIQNMNEDELIIYVKDRFNSYL